MNFDSRARTLSDEIHDHWEENVKKQYRENGEHLIAELRAEYGPWQAETGHGTSADGYPFLQCFVHAMNCRIPCSEPALTGLQHLLRRLPLCYTRTCAPPGEPQPLATPDPPATPEAEQPPRAGLATAPRPGSRSHQELRLRAPEPTRDA